MSNLDYIADTLPNGLRLVHLPVDSPVAYCGLAVNAGTRDERPDEMGLAHFVEHMLFKGTDKRRSWHILNRMENVGGELNAYTTKEETFIYSIFMEEHFGRALELMADLALNARFPAREIEKEVEVILDEINSYEDSPSELIFDEFFSMGRTDFRRIRRMAMEWLGAADRPMAPRERIAPPPVAAVSERVAKETHQAHVLLGGRAYSLHDDRRVALFLLNNLLGGPGMNSRLNVALREREGLVYTVESNITSYTDTGVATIYFGTDPKKLDKALRLTRRELALLRERRLTTTRLAAAKKQLMGQLGVASDNRESLFLGLGKSFLHYNRYDTLPEVFAQIDRLTADDVLAAANEVFDPAALSQRGVRSRRPLLLDI